MTVEECTGDAEHTANRCSVTDLICRCDYLCSSSTAHISCNSRRQRYILCEQEKLPAYSAVGLLCAAHHTAAACVSLCCAMSNAKRTRIVRSPLDEMSRASFGAGEGGSGFLDAAFRGGSTYHFTRSLLRGFGVPRRYATGAAAASTAAGFVPDCIDWFRRTERSFRTIPQCSLIEGSPEERNPLYEKRLSSQSRQPYDFEYSKPGYTFSGIACLPVSAEIQSPEAQVISGGINCSSVTIRLTPLEEGEWACRVLLYGKPCTTGPSAEEFKQTRRVDAPASFDPILLYLLLFLLLVWVISRL